MVTDKVLKYIQAPELLELSDHNSRRPSTKPTQAASGFSRSIYRSDRRSFQVEVGALRA